MVANLARKRHDRALKRRQAAGLKRRLELVESTVAARAARASLAPIQLCALHGEITDSASDGGMASVILARGLTSNHATVAIFLVDLHCLGIKDVIFEDFERDELALVLEGMAATAPLCPFDPAAARKLLRDVAAWAATIGFEPHREFAAAEQLFGEVDAAACETEFVFGLDGKPFYVPGPTETRAQIRRRFAHLLVRCGPDGFDYIREAEGDGEARA